MVKQKESDGGLPRWSRIWVLLWPFSRRDGAEGMLMALRIV